MPTFIRMIYKVIYDAIYHFSEDDGWAMASHVALSSLLAIFPFLIFGTALASFLGADQFAETAVHLIFDTWPATIADPISREVTQVLTVQYSGLLTVSVVAAAYFASNGVEALRVSLNRAYRVQEMRPWYLNRVRSLFYVFAAVLAMAAVSVFLVAVPLAETYLSEWVPWLVGPLQKVEGWRVWGTVLVLTFTLIVTHMYMPAGERRLVNVLPGIVLTLLAWAVAAYVFAYYLATFANYARTYAGLGSIVIVLVFLYMIGVIFILGAEVNAALMKYDVLNKSANSNEGS